MNNAISQLVILGGGSAGWLTAGVLAAEYGQSLTVTVVESPDVPTIGVGEGTWPTMRETLRKIGITETRFLRECDASFKQGSKFIAWRSGLDEESYYHPFSLPLHFFDADSAALWHASGDEQGFGPFASAQTAICDASLAPKQSGTPDYAAVLNYGYHLDAGKFGELLRQHCVEKLGVRHVLDHVNAVVPAEDGSIAALDCRRSGPISGDLFVDCSGSASVLLGKHFGIEFESRSSVLFNDRALAVQVPYREQNQPIASVTLSTARRAGWIWDIGLPTRRGIGYVYSSSHSSDDQAEAELRSYLGPLMGSQAAATAELRQLRFNPGHRSAFWHKNCVAVGMSSGFIEPLEASALAMVEQSAAMIRDNLPGDRSLMESAANRFNDGFRYRWDRIIDFLKLHYVLSDRSDSDYWHDHRDASTIPERLQELLAWWRYRTPTRNDFPQNEEIFTAASYQYVLYGMGFRTHYPYAAANNNVIERLQKYRSENSQQVNRFMGGLPSNRALLDALR
ncbi:MAG: tryptophan halogenase family protein [Halioglobus sp.]